jgi:large subunit ribosomal protein L33
LSRRAGRREPTGSDITRRLTPPGPPFFASSPSRAGPRSYPNSFPEVRAMAKKAKDARSYVKIVSSESDHCYFVQKNRNNTKGRLELRKYDPTIRKHVPYKESK